MRRDLFVRVKSHPAESGRPTGASFELALDRESHLGAVFDLEPAPTDKLLLRALAVSFGIAAAVNLWRSLRNLTSLALHLQAPIHPRWQDITGLLESLTGFRVDLDTEFHSDSPVWPAGGVFLVSGGKDTLFALRQAERDQCLAGWPAVYLGAGSEINWRTEISQVDRLVQHFGLRLQHVRLYTELVSSKFALRFGNRASWRELVTITLARAHGNQIFTGLNIDALSRLEVTPSNTADFLGQLLPTLEALKDILGARIEMVPGDLEVYREICSDPLFNLAGSCLRPDCDDANLCAKCRTVELQARYLNGEGLTADDLRFIHSEGFLGDAALLAIESTEWEGVNA